MPGDTLANFYASRAVDLEPLRPDILAAIDGGDAVTVFIRVNDATQIAFGVRRIHGKYSLVIKGGTLIVATAEAAVNRGFDHARRLFIAR